MTEEGVSILNQQDLELKAEKQFWIVTEKLWKAKLEAAQAQEKQS